MKVLFINSVVDYGSTGKIVRDLANGIKSQGHDVKMVFGRNAPKDLTDTVNISDKAGTLWHVLMTRLFGRHGMHSTRATKKLIAYIHEYQPDVIHMHNLHGYYLNVPLLLNALQSTNAKLLLTLHDCWTYSGSSAYFEYHGCKVWDQGCVESHSTKDYPEVFGYVNQHRNFKWKQTLFTNLPNLTVITPSNWLSNLTRTTFLGKFDVKTIYNGIDLSVFKPTASPQIEGINISDKVYLGVSSVWEPRKGLNYCVELSKHLKNNEKIVLVGLTEKQIESLPKSILGITRTSSMVELAQLYTRADVFINPTLEDNFPTTNLESIACGTPVLTFNTGGSPEAIDAKTGYVTKEKTTESLLEGLKIVQSLEHVETACIQRAHKYFNKQDMIDSYLELILTKTGD